MTREELQDAIAQTHAEIVRVKEQIEEATDPAERRRLKSRLKELQYLQLWHLDQIG